MDPNEALRNILRGYEVEEHIEALIGWLSKQGFKPEIEISSEESLEENWPYLACTFVDFTRIIRASLAGIEYYAVNGDGREELITTTSWGNIRNDIEEDDPMNPEDLIK